MTRRSLCQRWMECVRTVEEECKRDGERKSDRGADGWVLGHLQRWRKDEKTDTREKMTGEFESEASRKASK